MPKSRLPALALAVLGIVLACSDNNVGSKYNYLRSPSEFTVDTLRTGDPANQDEKLCANSDARDSCLGRRKFTLTWDMPEDMEGFQGYRIYLDTMRDRHTGQKHWKQLQGSDPDADLVITDTTRSLTFFLCNGCVTWPETLSAASARVVAFDTSSRRYGSRLDVDTVQQRKAFVFALVARYGGSGEPGQPRYTPLITDDQFKPDPINPAFRPGSRDLTIEWTRPTDPTSYFNPAADTGLISSYWVQIEPANRTRQDSKTYDSLDRAQLADYQVDGRDRKGDAAVKDSLNKSQRIIAKIFALPDGGRSHAHAPSADSSADRIRVRISGLLPQDTFTVTLSYADSNGNRTVLAPQTIILTDITQPSPPAFGPPDTNLPNTLVLRWTPARDSLLNADSSLRPGDKPNQNIKEYRLTRRSDGGDSVETVIGRSGRGSIPFSDTLFLDTIPFLPPGATYHFSLYAVDSTGFASRADTLSARIPAVTLGPGYAAVPCAPGFVPIPGGTFTLGSRDGQQFGQKDEGPAPAPVYQAPFCIEAYEHRDSAGHFLQGVTWDQAEAACEALGDRYGKGRGFQLCTEAEWERACEGPDTSALPHGIMAEKAEGAGLLQSRCNQGTGDAEMADSLALRDPICITTEGVYDLAGNLSEWVKDFYDPNAYSLRIPANDSLSDTPLTSTQVGNYPHSIRGGNYLRPNKDIASVQALARCSNRDYPALLRPARDTLGCTDAERQKIVVRYASGRYFCVDLPDSLRGRVLGLYPLARDSSRFKVQYAAGQGSAVATLSLDPNAYPDTGLLRQKPSSLALTTPALAEVVFRPSGMSTADSILDTLDAREFYGDSNLTQAVLRREAGAGWTGTVIRYLYGAPVDRIRPAGPAYASSAIGFRCCSRPAPADTAVAGAPPAAKRAALGNAKVTPARRPPPRSSG